MNNNNIYVGITGVGKCLGEMEVSNQEVAEVIIGVNKNKKYRSVGSAKLTPEELKAVSTDDQWMRDRSGIESRYYSQLPTSKLAAEAAKLALENSGRNKHDCQFIIVATVSPDFLYSPPTACLVHRELGLKVRNQLGLENCLVVDTSSACTSFGSALTLGYSLIKSGLYKFGLVIGADKMSSTVDPGDRSFSFLMGDAAGAFALERVKSKRLDSFPWGANSFFCGTDPSGADKIKAPAGGSARPLTLSLLARAETCVNKTRPDKLWQDGKAVFKDIINLISNTGVPAEEIVVGKALSRAGVNLSDVDMIFPHQANLRISEAIADNLFRRGFRGKVYDTIQKYGNTTSAAVPLGVAEAWKSGELKKRMTIMLLPFGGGYSFTSILVRWTADIPCPV